MRVHRGGAALALLGPDWDRLAVASPSPFLTAAWLRSWWAACGRGEPVCPALHGPDGRLRAAVLFQRAPFGGLVSAANVYSDDWDAVAEDDAARAELWEAVARLDVRYVRLAGLRLGVGAKAAERALTAGGFRLLAAPGNLSPYLELPDRGEDVLVAATRTLRGQVRRRRRQLEREGTLTVRTVTGGDELDPALDALLRVEASGWKGRRGTAIASSPATRTLYRRFAHAAAEAGWLRVHLLELDGRPIAGDLGCAIADTGFLLKTGYDEALHRLSPGLVLRAEVLQAMADEGLRGYDFLGPNDPYKLRWTSTVRPRATIRALRGAAVPPGAAYHRAIRPTLKRAHAALGIVGRG